MNLFGNNLFGNNTYSPNLFRGKVSVVSVAAVGGAARVKYLDLKRPWEQDEPDWIDEEIKKALDQPVEPKRELLTLDKVDISAYLDREIKKEFEHLEKERKRRNRKKAIDMLLRSL